MKTNNKKNALVMCECAIMIALAAVLSFVKILELPYGGVLPHSALFRL